MHGKRIVITGGSGLVGNLLTELLLSSGYEVCHIGRKSGSNNGITSYKWDVSNNYLDPEALKGASAIIHLAGAPVNKRWTKKYKKVILESRVATTQLLYEKLKSGDHSITTFISASGVNIYPDDQPSKAFEEECGPGNKFLAKVCHDWEAATNQINQLNIRTSQMRIGVVLSTSGGALEKLMLPIKFGLGSVLGSGKQWMSWIHQDDLCRIIQFVLENDSISGPINAVSPNPLQHTDFVRCVAKVLNKPMILPKVPGFLLKLVLGEMATIVLDGVKVSSKKIQHVGFQFNFNHLQEALEDLLMIQTDD